MIGIDLEHDAASVGRKRQMVIDELFGIAGVVEIHETMAPFDLLVKLRSPDLASFRHDVSTIAGIDSIMATNTQLILKTIMKRD